MLILIMVFRLDNKTAKFLFCYTAEGISVSDIGNFFCGGCAAAKKEARPTGRASPIYYAVILKTSNPHSLLLPPVQQLRIFLFQHLLKRFPRFSQHRFFR